MTDGIIQKILRRHELTCKDALKIEQELVQAIKDYHFDNDKYFDDTIKQQLIGDNNEQL
jgi:hypothetical protein